MKTRDLALGVLAGAAAGAVLGILFAPEKGKDTRKKISDKSKDLASTAKTKAQDYVSVAKEQLNSIANNFAATTNRAIENGKELADDAKANLDNLKQMNKSVL